MDEVAVQAVVQKYVDGVKANDVELTRSAFREDAHLWGYLGKTFLTIPVSGFLDVVAGAPDPGTWIGGYVYQIRSIEVTGDVAVAVLEEAGYLGADFVNYFSLVREDEQWAIASKTFFLTRGSLPLPG